MHAQFIALLTERPGETRRRGGHRSRRYLVRSVRSGGTCARLRMSLPARLRDLCPPMNPSPTLCGNVRTQPAHLRDQEKTASPINAPGTPPQAVVSNESPNQPGCQPMTGNARIVRKKSADGQKRMT